MQQLPRSPVEAWFGVMLTACKAFQNRYDGLTLEASPKLSLMADFPDIRKPAE